MSQMQATIETLISSGKGILAADESLTTIAKRFDAISVENTENNRQEYRSLLCSTPDLSDHISGVILFEETLKHKIAGTDQTIPEYLSKQGILPGVKVDKGLVTVAPATEEKITRGLDTLADRLSDYAKSGVKFAKWRAVYSIDDGAPTDYVIRLNSVGLARYAAICQQHDIVPIVEPEVLMDGSHSIDECAAVSEKVFRHVFSELAKHNVRLEHMILKPNMIVAGKSSSEQPSSAVIASKTLEILSRTVPSAVPGIFFLSGGQSPDEATNNLNAINKLGNHPWYVSFSYGRALQETCLGLWRGHSAGLSSAQQELYARAKQNGLAAEGKL